MLQPKKSAKQVIAESYNRQFEELSPLQRDILDIKIKNSGKTPEVINTFSDDQLKLFKEKGISASEYDDIDVLLGQSQSGWERAFNVIARGLLKIPLAAVEPIGHGLDYVTAEAWQDIDKGERDFQNGFNNWLKDLEGQLDESYPVYTGHMPDEPTPLVSGAWWAKNGDQMIRSGGYYLYGAAAGRLIGGAVTALATRGIQGAIVKKTAQEMAKTALNIERGSRLTAAAFTGISQNFGEHNYSAGEAFKENYEEYVKIFRKVDPNASDEEIQRRARIKAGQDASQIIKKGKLNLLFEIPSNYMLFRGAGSTRSLAGMATSGGRKTAQRAATIAYEPTQEYFEEVWTGHLEKEARRKVGVEKGYYDEDYTTEFDRYADHVVSYEGITEGLTGLIGSGPFTIKASMQSHKARKTKLERAKKNAAFAGDLTKYRNLNEMSLFETFRFNAQEGTYENMIMHFEDIANMSPEDAAKKGMDPDYATKAKGAIDKALEFENDFNSHIFQYKDPLKADVLTASKFVQNSIREELKEAEGELSKAEILSSEYFNAKGYPAGIQGLSNNLIQIEALQISKQLLEAELATLEKDVKNNKDRTLDTRETGEDINKRIEHINSKIDKAVKERDSAYKTLEETGTSISEVNAIMNEALVEGAPLHNQAKVQASVEGLKAQYALENDRYTNFINNPKVLNKEVNNIKANSKKVEKAKKANAKKAKAADKAAKSKVKVTSAAHRAKTDPVEGQGSTADNLNKGDEADAILKSALESGKNAPDDINLEVQGPNTDENIDRLLSDANKASNDNIEVFQTMLEGQLTPEQTSRLEAAKANNDILAQSAKDKDTEKDTNIAEVVDAVADDKTIGESDEGSRQVKNFNYDKDKTGSIPFERQDSATEAEDKKLLNNETRKSLTASDEKIAIATKQIVNGANAMAYLSTEYISRIIKTPQGDRFVRHTASKDKTKGLVPEVESPNFLQPGENITLKVVGKDAKGLRYVYDEMGMPKEVSWEYSDFVNEDGSVNSNLVPIEIIAKVKGEDTVIGYVHETTWIDAELSTGQPRNVVESQEFPNNWERQKNEIRGIRKIIVNSGGEVSTTINSVSTGTPFLNIRMNEDGTMTTETEWAGVKDLMPGWKELPIVFRRLGSWQESKNTFVDKVIANDKDYSDGRIGLVLPTKQSNTVFVAPLWTKPLDNKQIDTILGAVAALKSKTSAGKDITNALGFDFSSKNPKALYTFINRIVYTKRFEFNPSNSNSTVYLDVNAKNNTILLASERGRTIYTNKVELVPRNLKNTSTNVKDISDPANLGAVRAILSTMLPSLNIDQANALGKYTSLSLDSSGEITDVKAHDSYKDYALDIVQTNINGTNSFQKEGGEVEYTYINQPVIQFSKDFKTAEESDTTDTIREELRGKESPKPSEPTVDDILDDLNDEFNYNISHSIERTEDEGATVETVERYTVADLKANPDKIYIFGDNSIKKGKGGQAVIRGEGNAFGIPTKKLPSTGENAYFTDEELESNKQEIRNAIDIIKVEADSFFPRNVVFPADGIGTGLAKLKEKAPKTYQFLQQELVKNFGFNNDTGIVADKEEDQQGYYDESAEAIEAAQLDKGLYTRLDPFFIDVQAIPANRQKEILKYTTAKVTNDFLKAEGATVNESLESARQTFVKLKNAAGFSEKSEVFRNDITSVLNNWEKVEALTLEELAVVHNITPSQVNKESRSLEKTSFIDEARWQSDPKKKASARMKIKMSQILKRDKSGTPIKNYLGLYSFYDYSEVWDGAMGTLTEPLHNLESMLDHLNNKGKINPMFSELATYVKNRLTFEEKNEFVSQFANAYTSQRLTLFSKDKTGNYVAEIIDSAGSKSANIIKDRWLTEQLRNENLVKYSADGEAYIDVDYVNYVKASYLEGFDLLSSIYPDRAERNNSDELFELLASTLSSLSVTVPQETLRHLATPIPNSNKTMGDDLLGQSWAYAIDPKSSMGLVNLIIKAYQKNAPDPASVKYDAEVQESAKPLYKNNPLKGDNFQGITLKLADITSQFGDPVYHISYRDGEGKTVFPYNGVTSMHTTLKLYENYNNDKISKSLVDGILATHMGSVSRLLPKIIKNKGVLKIHYTDVLKDKYGSDSKAAKRKNQGKLQQDLNSAWSFQNSNKEKGFFFGITKADRSISELIEHNKVDFKDQIQVEEGKVVSILKKAEDHLYSYAMGEVKRIYSTQSKLDENEDYLEGQKYRKGSQYFHSFSFLNQHEIGSYVTEEEVKILYAEESFDGIPRLDIVNAEPILRKAINAWTTDLINETLERWEDLGVTGGLKNKLSVSYMSSLGVAETSIKDKEAIAAGDLEINAIISNIEQQILFGGDMAEAYNGKGSTVAQTIESARAHNEKRLIGTDAPKSQGNFVKREYTSATFKDRVVFSENYAYYDRLFGKNSPYGNPSNKSIESTDALEFTTTQEHINFLQAFGKIPEAIHASMSKKIENAIEDVNNTTNYYRLTEEETSFALKPVKPQYDFMHPDAKTGRLSRFYRKSAAIPLIPDMTSDMQLDNIRIAMEYEKVDRIGHKTSDKLSNKNPVNAYDSKGDVLSVEELRANMKANAYTLYRDGLGIQQEKNVKESQVISVPTQKAKLQFSGLLEETFIIDGKEVLGKKVQVRKEELISAIYKGKHNKLLSTLGNINREVDENGDTIAITDDQVNMKVFVAAIKEEAKKRKWSINDIFSLDLNPDGTTTLIPLPFIQSRKMLEGLMLSMVNQISNIKIPGITFTQISSAGFKAQAGAWGDMSSDMRNEVITTTNFDESKGLQGPRWDEAKSEVVPGQVMVKFFYKDSDGKELDIKAKDANGEYIFLFEKNGRLFLNSAKVPKEIRQLIGYRIPYQSIGSEMPLEIVGFLPSNMELTIVVPDEILAQMGSDFDYDALNSIISQYIVRRNEDGSVKGVYRKDREKHADKFTEEELMLDELRDIFWATLTTNKKSFDKMSLGIDDPALENLAEEISTILNSNLRTKTPIARIDQIESNISQRMGQVLIGPTAQANTLNAIFEGKNIHLVRMKETKKDKYVQEAFTVLGLFTEEKYTEKGVVKYKPLKFSDLSGENKTVYYKQGKKTYRTSSDVINIFLNAAVDNANKPTLGKLNMTMETLPTIMFMAIGGVNVETLAYMNSQEIMRDYTQEIAKIVPGLSDKNVFKREKEAEAIVLKKYQELAKLNDSNEVAVIVEKYSDASNDNFEMLFQSAILKEQLILGAPGSAENMPAYHEKQIAIFKKFLKFKGYSDRLNPIRKAVNDSSVKGLGSSISGAKSQIERFKSLNLTPEQDASHPKFAGLSSLKGGEYSNLGKYLESAFTLINNAYPVDTSYISDLETMLINNSNEENISESSMDLIFNSIISNSWSYAIQKAFVENAEEATSLYELRRKLFIEENNIAVQTLKAQSTDWGKKNEYVSALNPIIPTNKNKGKASVGIDWASNPDNLAMQRGFTSLFMGSPEEEVYGKNLVIAAYLNGGHQKATSYLKFIPFGALEKYGLTQHLKGEFFTGAVISENISLMAQVMQHNPWKATVVDYKSKELASIIKTTGSEEVIEGLTFPSMEDSKELPALDNFKYFNKDLKESSYKEFLAHSVGSTYQLFKLSHSAKDGTVFYNRIDLKGDKFGTEYDFSGNLSSYIEANKIIKSVEVPEGSGLPIGIPWDEVPSEDDAGFLTPLATPGTSPLGFVDEFKAKSEEARHQLDALLDTVIQTAPEGQQELAKMLKQKGIYRAHEFQGVIMSPKLKRDGKKVTLGVYKHDAQIPEASVIEIYEGSIQAINATQAKVAETMLHETMHYFTVAALEERDLSLPAKRFSAVINNLWTKADKAYKLNYKSPVTQREILTDSRIRYSLYGKGKSKNVKEFVTGMSTNSEFQEFLNNIPYNKTESLYRKIINAIKSYYQAIAKELGFDVKEGSALDVGLSEMLIFLNVEETTMVELAPEQIRTAAKDVGALANALGGIRPVMNDNGEFTGETIVTGPLATPTDVLVKAKNDAKTADLRRIQNEEQKIVDSLLTEHSSEWQKQFTGRVTKDGQNIDKYYHSNSPKVETERVSEFYKKDAFTGDTKLRDTSVAIGNTIDELVRKVMNNETPSENPIYDKVISEISNRRDQLIKDGYKIISDEIVLGDQDLGVAGTTDIIAINKSGGVKIIDTKSVRNGTSKLFQRGTGEISENGKKWYIDKWTNQLNMYRLLAERIGPEVRVESLEILPIRVDYEVGDVNPAYTIVEKSIAIPITTPIVEEANEQKFQRWMHKSKKELELASSFDYAKSSILEDRITSIKYTDDQVKALLTVSEFMLSPDTRESKNRMLLAGYAGTGKTTIIENMIKHARLNGKSVVVTAPTNVAVLVIKEKLKAVGINLDPKEELVTNHRFLYGAPNPDTGNFEPKLELENAENTLHIMDEASMLATKELDAFGVYNDQGMKTVFIGDSFQLPPVVEKKGDDPKLFDEVQMDFKLEMTEVKRQGLDSPVLTVATNMRNTKTITIPSASADNFVLPASVQEFQEHWLADLEAKKDIMYIAASNPYRINANILARKRLFGDNADVIEDGDILVSVSNSSPTLLNSRGEKVSTLANGEVIGGDRSKTYTKHPERPELTTIYLPNYTKKGKKQTTKAIKVQALKDEMNNTVLLFPDYDKASILHQDLINTIANRFPIQDIAKREINSDYLSPFIVTEKTKYGTKSIIDRTIITAFYGYALTGHKSQGSQWGKVYVDHSFSGILPSGEVYFEPSRWLYTAITRAENSVEMVPQRHHFRASMEAIRNAVNGQLAPNETKVVSTPASQKTYASILEIAAKELIVYRELIEKHGEGKVLDAMKNQFESVKDFEDSIDLEIYESGINSFVVDMTDLPVNAHGEIAEIIQSIEGRIKDIQRRETPSTPTATRIYFNSQIDALKEDIEKLKEGNNTFVIEDVAVRQLDWASNILNRPELSLQEINDAGRIVDIWNFDNTKHLLSSEQLINKDNPTRKVFSDIGSRAQDIGVTMSAKRTEWVKSYTKTKSGEAITDDTFNEDGFLNLREEGWFRGKFLDAANFNNPVVRATDSALKEVARNTEDNALNLTLEIQKEFKNLRVVLRDLGLNEDIFLQKDEDGNPSGFFVSKFTRDYYKDLGKLHKTHKDAMKRVMGSTRLTGDQIRQERFEAFKNLYDAKNSMEVTIDTRFWTVDGHTSNDAKSKEAYIEYLEKELGEGNAADLIGRAEDGVAKYNLEKAAHRNKIATDVVEGVLKPLIGMTLQETADAKHTAWVNKNSLEYYLDQRYNTTKENVAWGTLGWKYAISHPKGEKYMDSEFSTIENNADLSAFYEFWTNTMATMKSYLPEVAVHEMSDNFFPTMQKDLIEEYMRNGSVAALSYLNKDIEVYGALFADDVLTLNREREGLKSELDERGIPISKVPLRFLNSDDVDISDRAFDMERVMVMFGNMAMNYKYKSEAEPLVNILMRTIRDSVQPLIDSNGKPIKRWKSSQNITVKEAPQIVLESLEFAQQSIVYGRKPSERNTSWEFPGNLSADFLARNRKAKELKAEYEELHNSLVDGDITQAQYNDKIEIMEEEFKDLNIKAVSFSKVIKAFIGYTQLKGLGWNVSAGIANVGFGFLASAIHASGEEDFTTSQFGQSFRIVLGASMSPTATKTAAIMKRFNLLFEMREVTYGKGDVRGDSKFKMLSKLAPMQMQQSTEFVVQSLSAVAKMINTVVVDLDGNSRNLYEAFNDDGTWNLKEFGYQKEWDYSNLNALTSNSYTKFRNGAIEMNKKLHGNYDPNSLLAIKSKDINLLFTIFRTWAFEGFNTRYSKKIYNEQLGRYTKGRYQSIWNVGLKESAAVITKLMLKRATGQSTGDILGGIEEQVDAANLRKTLSALKAQALIMGLGAMLKALAKGLDDDEEAPVLIATLNILFRVEQDLSYYRHPVTFLNVFKDPTPVIKTITDLTRAVDGTQMYILKDDYRGDHPVKKWAKVFPFSNQIYKWTVITEKELDTSYGMSNWLEDNLLGEEE